MSLLGVSSRWVTETPKEVPLWFIMSCLYWASITGDYHTVGIRDWDALSENLQVRKTTPRILQDDPLVQPTHFDWKCSTAEVVFCCHGRLRSNRPTLRSVEQRKSSLSSMFAVHCTVYISNAVWHLSQALRVMQTGKLITVKRLLAARIQQESSRIYSHFENSNRFNLIGPLKNSKLN